VARLIGRAISVVCGGMLLATVVTSAAQAQVGTGAVDVTGTWTIYTDA
jgi:hypothetical protein